MKCCRIQNWQVWKLGLMMVLGIAGVLITVPVAAQLPEDDALLPRFRSG